MKTSFNCLLCCAAFVTAVTAWAGPVNVNTADAETLAAELTGIGPALARAIVEDRDQNGLYSKPEDLTRVSGIGLRVVENNREFIRVDAAD
ncbi:MAG: ComEA family DNA-binding protein [Gammaproteobacteria bacterium]|jgi:competence protein ComEA